MGSSSALKVRILPQIQMKGKNDLDISPLAGSERIGGRQRDKSSVYAAESEALDQIAKEVCNII